MMQELSTMKIGALLALMAILPSKAGLKKATSLLLGVGALAGHADVGLLSRRPPARTLDACFGEVVGITLDKSLVPDAGLSSDAHQ